MHLVHTRKDFYVANNEEYYAKCDTENGTYCGLAVVGILFHIGSEDNPALAVSTFNF